LDVIAQGPNELLSGAFNFTNTCINNILTRTIILFSYSIKSSRNSNI
jgi:hypothetical protein